MQFEFSRPRGHGLDDLGGQNRVQIRTRQSRLPPGIDFGGRNCNLNFKGRKVMTSATLKVKPRPN